MNDYQKHARRLFWLNVAAGLFHWASFAAALIVSLVKSDDIFTSQVTLTILEDAGGGTVNPVTHLLGKYKLTGTLVSVPALTGTFHLLLALVPSINREYSRGVLNDGRPGAGYNVFRWVEYALSASLVTWNVAQVSGISDLFTLLGLCALNILMQLVGGAGHELLNIGWTPRLRVKWVPFLLGWVPFVFTWGFIWAAFALAVKSAIDAVPWFVYAVVIGIFIQYCLFALPIVLHYTGTWLVDNFWYEAAYIVLSFVSKFYLDWVLIAGSLTR